MTERFNFYDVYGFVLPGFAALSLTFGCVYLTTGWFPDVELGETVAALVVAYLLGAGIHEAARGAVPSRWRTTDCGERRMPSDALLDKGVLQDDLRAEYAQRLMSRFKVDIDDPDSQQAEKARNTGFLLARTALVQEGVATYGQQFQGLQALFRGLAAVAWFTCWLGVTAGLAAWAWWLLLLPMGAVYVMFSGLVSPPKAARWAALAAVALGAAVGLYATHPAHPVLAIGLGIAACLLVRPLVETHNRMAEQFVHEVVRAFAVARLSTERPES